MFEMARLAFLVVAMAGHTPMRSLEAGDPGVARALSAKTFGILAVIGLVVAFSLSSTLKRAESPGVLVAFWRMVTVSVVWNVLLWGTGQRVTMRNVRQAVVPGVSSV